VARRSTVEADAAKGMFYVYFSSWENARGRAGRGAAGPVCLEPVAVVRP
jgi:hypothetical protein